MKQRRSRLAADTIAVQFMHVPYLQTLHGQLYSAKVTRNNRTRDRRFCVIHLRTAVL